MPVYAASGSVHISFKDLQTKESNPGNVPILLYQVGEVDEYGAPEFYQEYGISEYPQDSEALDAAAAKVAAAVKGEVIYTKKTDAKGEALFADVKTGVYLVTIPEDNQYGQVTPFIIQLPYYEEVNGQMNGPLYDVKAEPKASPNEIITPTASPKTTPKVTPKVTPKPTTTPKVVPTPQTTEKKAAKTGDTAQPQWYVFIGAAAVFSVVIIVTGINRRKRL